MTSCQWNVVPDFDVGSKTGKGSGMAALAMQGLGWKPTVQLVIPATSLYLFTNFLKDVKCGILS